MRLYVNGAEEGFNPRARMGRDLLFRDLDLVAHAVSIHAPAWGATHVPAWHGEWKLAVSIHAPAWGATTTNEWVHYALVSFNPRARMGRDRRPNINSWSH